ncbi:MAG: L,D-transpeptidase family protein [Candidatus Competibacteraceae bacterium]|nr:MAG: L,D-transpeptidase family protein [Candidatus Competibacteraceae bacterium]
MSKRIIFPIWLCILLGACAFNTWPVVAQVAGGQGPEIQRAGGGAVGMGGMSSVASPQADQNSESADEAEPPPAEAQTLPADPMAGPPPLPPCPTGDGLAEQVAAGICQQVRIDPPPSSLRVDKLTLHSLEYLIPFYAGRNYRAAWLDAGGKPLPVADSLLRTLGQAEHEGLRSTDYPHAHLRKLYEALQRDTAAPTAGQLADFDLLFTDTFLTYGSHLLSGRLPPRKIDPEWTIKPRSRDLTEVLERALADDTVAKSLQALSPRSKGYVELREVLRRYRTVEQAGGWPLVGSAKGVRGSQVERLRARLQASGDLPAGQEQSAKNGAYDKSVAEALRRFQKRHGLKETGTVNTATLAALNVPVSERMRQVELNMERWRWLPDDFGPRYILVNIPSFKMGVFENGRQVMEAKVVVGRQERQTPTFTANMAYLVLSPKWYVPRSIAVKDKLPQLKRNPYALKRQKIRIYNSAGQEIDPGSIDWRAVSAKSFRYQLRQDAGPRNALGGIKFMFPNPYSIYLHDTPSRELFSRNQRTYSSGCIRISNPVELANYLLKHDPKWNKDTIKTAAASGKQRVVRLPEEVPVYLLYWTAWVDDEGFLNFRDDIYQRDKPMVRALYQKGVIQGGDA